MEVIYTQFKTLERLKTFNTFQRLYSSKVWQCEWECHVFLPPQSSLWPFIGYLCLIYAARLDAARPAYLGNVQGYCPRQTYLLFLPLRESAAAEPAFWVNVVMSAEDDG